MSADFRGKWASPTIHCWCQKTRMIAVSCGIKTSAVRHLVLSQYTHLTDRETDGRTELRQQYHALHYMQSRGKNVVLTCKIRTEPHSLIGAIKIYTKYGFVLIFVTSHLFWQLTKIFYIAPQSIAYQSVFLPVRHTPVLCQNEETQREVDFTIG